MRLSYAFGKMINNSWNLIVRKKGNMISETNWMNKRRIQFTIEIKANLPLISIPHEEFG